MSKSINHKVPGRDEATRFEKIHNVCFTSVKEGSRMVALEIANAIKSCSKKHYILGLATGSSPIGVYKELIRLHKNEGLSFKKVITFNLDEYFPIKKTNEKSYNSFMFNHLFSQIDILKKNIHIPNGEINEKDISRYCNQYEKKIISYGGLDFQLLGIGRTAHIGFNEPGSHKNSLTRIVNLDYITKEDASAEFNGISLVPSKAITMGIRTILNAKRIVLLAWGHKKLKVVSKSIEGSEDRAFPASFLQSHPNTTFILDKESSAGLIKFKTPWLVKDCIWDDSLKKKAITWLSKKTNVPILKLTKQDYNENGLASLVLSSGSVYDLNIWMFNKLQRTITGWPGGKPNTEDIDRPERAKPSKKRVIIFSPHPDDDVISMGGTLTRLVDQGHDVHIAYQTSGNIGVSDKEVLKYLEVAQSSFSKENRELKKAINSLRLKKNNNLILDIKSAIRRSESYAASWYLGLEKNKLHFLNLPFYESGKIKKKDPTSKDIKITKNIIKEIKPHQIFAAGDLADPHGTHRVCLNILLLSLKEMKSESFINSCWLWLYRGAWEEWDIVDIEMAVPMSPSQVLQKRNAILFHQSQKDKVMFQGEDNREFWLRAEQRNKKNAKLYNKLGMAEYEAMEGFKRYHF
ncbi:MAG: glucosamine-6-phosphate deaminase [Flavobacteriaceae bacterium]|nr:glucosamine-6-phosphate deaminase [Flavobacteriaceae bacterium]